MKTEYDIVRTPLITEKFTLIYGPLRKYVFIVDKKANKIEIKNAIEKIYKVEVDKVHTMNIKGKKKRVRWQQGFTSSRKKAIVTLKEGFQIEINRG